MPSRIEYVRLGKSGLKIAPIIVGCMTFGSPAWRDWVLDEEESFKILKKCYDEGLRTFDTADMYSEGVSEEIVGKFLKLYNIPRENVVILSKVFYVVDPERLKSDKTQGTSEVDEYANLHGLSRKHIIDGVNASVKRLGTYIDVLQIHRLDHTTDPEEIMEALHDVKKQGLCRYIGASSMRAYEFVELQHIAETHGWTKFISMQNYHNVAYREEEREMIPFCKSTGVGIIPWSPLARGLLTRPPGDVRSTTRGKSDTMINSKAEKLLEMDRAVVEKVAKVSKDRNVSQAIVCLAWSLSKGVNPIVGLSKIDRIEQAIQSLSFKLSKEEIEFLDADYEPRPVMYM